MLLGELSALLTAFCWSGSSLSFSDASRRIGSLQLNINRMILAAVFLSVTIFLAGFNYQISYSQAGYLAVSGFVGLVIGDTFLFKAYQHIGARLSMLLMALVPAISSLMAYFFLDEILSALGIIGIIVTITGVSVVVLEKKESAETSKKTDAAGILFGLIGALGQASGLIFAKFAFEEGHINGFVATFVRISSAVIFMLIVGIAAGRYNNPYRVFKNDLKALRSTILGTILGPYLGITFSLIAISNAKVGIASTIMSTVPIIMLPLVRIIYKEKLSMRAIWGAVAAVGGVAILFLR